MGRDDQDPVFYTDNLMFKFLPPQLELKATSGADSLAKPRDIIITRCTIAVISEVIFVKLTI